ncbi:MAG: hypothetical protein WD066_13065 [Planctomycetaceae bacterium]
MKTLLFAAVAAVGMSFVFGGGSAQAGHFVGYKPAYYPYSNGYVYSAPVYPIYTTGVIYKYQQPYLVYPYAYQGHYGYHGGKFPIHIHHHGHKFHHGHKH